MGKAGKALKQVLDTYGINQNQLAITMGIGRSTVHYWVNELRDPLAESIPDILEALDQLHPEAVQEFLVLYLGRFVQRELPDQ
ncbi:MAG: helix-turn-helix domain-containing protein [Drouetiella hepatica Uher 2000/2452]|jgi:transcriptional regulator with XRE-family HTH domain|uniref:Helix-turn-helix domain-containing protein n=1 Tax=Drouetiella hepatica Uher 2000/2452 TaxID=904376 RepID=A0A951UNR5_9CYAN|nr:helix-turn-helix domain-containing protein [Drouetiella hepatica Uher 2000/2452]